ncbi:hypothetical protein PV350_29370 [Streptomyces sp. PA03-6a]|nr:hypothetical protein [Streptomyces sp. PA03-6a]
MDGMTRGPGGPLSRGPGGAAGAPRGRLHRPGDLSVSPGPDRHHYWALLPEYVRARMTHGTGTVLEWWAHAAAGGGVQAVVLGTDGLGVAEPADGPGSSVRTLRLDPDSFVTRPFWSGPATPTARAAGLGAAASLLSGRAAPTHSPAAADAEGAQGAEPELTREARDFLGNLPPGAQRFLQQPFLGADRHVTTRWYFYEQPVAGGLSEMSVWCHLEGRRTVTFLSGTRRLPQGAAPAQATWSVVCRRAAVLHPAGP